MATFLAPLLKGSADGFVLVNGRTGATVADRLLPAFESKARRTGLLKHTSLGDGEAMIIAPSNGIHTWFMKFDIDVAFVNKQGDIVKVREAMGPWRMSAAFSAYAVVELASGTLAARDTRSGDRLVLANRSA
ncbi:MAG: DUF192 domain-containing protein [Vicinamibacterales bacterium]